MIIDGKKINEQIGLELQNKIHELKTQPHLGILCVGEDPASISYLKMKKEFGEKYGFIVNLNYLNENSSKDNIIEKLELMQTENDGVMLQLPLPKKLKNDTEEILESILEDKDVDVLTKKSIYTSPIVTSLLKVAKLEDKKIAIVGLGRLVGLPIRDYLKKENLNFVEVLKGEYEKIKDCDIVISGVGKANVIGAEFIKDGSMLIDYGWDKIGGVLVGDFQKECYEKASSYTPVPGGMGPIVVACLFENVLKAKKI